MSTEEMRGALALQQEIEKAKFRLRDVNENIKKITGRDPEEQRDRQFRAGNDVRGRERIFNMARRTMGGSDGPPAKRRNVIGGAFSRLGPRPPRQRQEDSGDDDEDQKHTVQSSVVATSLETRTKSLEKQSKDREGMARNKRMFGMILGTLQRFKTEAKDNKDKDDHRRKLEKKLDDKAEKEKLRVKQETRNLIDEKRLEMSKIRRLEQKMELVQEHESIKFEMTKLSNFLCTKAKPALFYMPKKRLAGDDVKLKDSVIFVNKLIEEKKAKMESEIEEIMHRENEREERIRARIAERSQRESGDEEDEEEEHHEDMDDHDDDQKAIDAHKASFREDKENVKKEPLSDNESNTHGEGFTVSGIKQEEGDIEMGEVECTVTDVGEGGLGKEGPQDKNTKQADDSGADNGAGNEENKMEAEDEGLDGGMVNTVGGGARAISDKDKDSRRHSKNKTDANETSKKSDRHSDDKDRHRTKSGHKDNKSRSSRDSKKSSSHRDERRRRSGSRDRKDRHRHSKRHSEDWPKRSRHDSNSDDDNNKSRDKTPSKDKSAVKETLIANIAQEESKPMESMDKEIGVKDNMVGIQDISTIELPPPKPVLDENINEDDLIRMIVTGDASTQSSSRFHQGRQSRESAEERKRKIVMAEDEEEMDDQPADE
ncbi:hypothetical protein SNE40_009509 [Patella caerulea]|uniref:Pinin n=1 Tax=Patella caerulea TaxID=87958 RepID=A0AAN8PYJ5_PATCE